MSTTGLYTGLYSTVRTMAELVDAVLLGLKSGALNEGSDQRQRLGTLLIRIAEPNSRDVTSNVLGILVKDSCKTAFDPVQLGNQLLGEEPQSESIKDLETLAAILENERASMLARMRGR